MKKLTVLILCVIFLFPLYVFAKNEPGSAKSSTAAVTKNPSTPVKNAPVSSDKSGSAVVEEQFKKSFPKNNFESITPTAIKGVYEVYAGNQLYYYMPKEDVVLYGALITKNGINITRESYLKKMAQKMAKVPLDSALKIGSGKTTVVEFIDPNCHFCRESYKFFAQRKDVTIYAFFFPLSKDSADKIKHILCSKDVVKTYDDVMNGKLDNNIKLSDCTDKKVEETVKTHMQLASQVGIKGTPLFYIKGQVVDGFDIPAIEKILKD